MKNTMYGLLSIAVAMGVFPQVGHAGLVPNINAAQAASVNNGNGANIGGAANQVAGVGQGAGGPGDGQGPGNGAGQGIGNAYGNSGSAGITSSPAPEPAIWVLLSVGALTGAYFLKRKHHKASRSVS